MNKTAILLLNAFISVCAYSNENPELDSLFAKSDLIVVGEVITFPNEDLGDSLKVYTSVNVHENYARRWWDNRIGKTIYVYKPTQSYKTSNANSIKFEKREVCIFFLQCKPWFWYNYPADDFNYNLIGIYREYKETFYAEIIEAAKKHKWIGWRRESKSYLDMKQKVYVEEFNLLNPVSTTYYEQQRNTYRYVGPGVNYPEDYIENGFGFYNFTLACSEHYYYDSLQNVKAQMVRKYYAIRESPCIKTQAGCFDKYLKYYTRSDSVYYTKKDTLRFVAIDST